MPFKIYADFECIVKRVKSADRGDRDDNASYTLNEIKNLYLAVLLVKLFVLIKLANQLFFKK